MKFQLKPQRTQELTLGRIVHTGALLVILLLGNEAAIANCEAKEFDWSDLGVSLANAKPALAGNPSNLRILVSPQRRKSYDFEYANGSQPIGASAGPGDASGANYVVASSSPYLSQSVYQLSPSGNHSVGHSSAYSALSASLATLKNRLNARGVTLTSTLGDGASGNAASAYLQQLDPASQQAQQQAQAQAQHQQQQQQQQQQQHQQQQQQQQQQQSQPTYLSVASQQDSVAPSLGAYTVPPSQGNESNKTIVLAIPAKINFLTGGSNSAAASSSSSSKQHLSQQQPQSSQQLSLLQTSGVIHGQEGATIEQAQSQQMGVAGEPQEQHHQYVIVNQQAQANSDHHSVAAGLSPTGAAGQAVYSTALYQPVQHSGAYATIKQYIPGPAAGGVVGQPTLQRVYSIVEPAQQQAQVVAAPVQQAAQYETQLVDQSALSASRYTTCLDTCNSSDPRWRKYTVSKYKACCSRSAQFDAATSIVEQPSVEKVSEQAARYSDDAYYNYLYRKSQRAKRTRRHRANRYSTGYTAGTRYSSASSAGPEEEPLDATGPVAPAPELRSAGRGVYSAHAEYPAKSSSYYKSSRAYAPSSSSSSSLAAANLDLGAQAGALEAPTRGEERGEPERAPAKYAAKERAYRRARARDLDAGLELPPPPPPPPPREQSGNSPADNIEDESVYPTRESTGARPSAAGAAQAAGSSYGSGEFSVDAQGRHGGYGGSDARDDEEAARYEEPNSELDGPSGKGASDDYYASGEVGPSSNGDSPSDDSETEAATSSSVYSRYPATGGSASGSARRRKPSKPRRKQKSSSSSSSPASYYKKSRKASSKSKTEAAGGQLNGTDYESAQPGDSASYYNQQEQNSQTGGGNNGHNQDQEDQTTYPSKESSTGGGYESSEAEKDAVLAKYRQSINETAVANLSKTTMHLKEILSILEKKATQQTLAGGGGGKYNESAASLPATSTPAPATTTTGYPASLSSLFGANSPYSSSLSSADFLASAADFASPSLKSPYRFDPNSPFSSAGPLSPSFSFGGPSSSSASAASFGSSSLFGPDSLGLPPLPQAPYPQYATFAHASKHSLGSLGANSAPGAGGGGGGGGGGIHVQKKRRPNKSSRYNDLVLQKAAAHGLVSPSSLALHAKNRLLNPAAAYYSALQYPYLYRANQGSLANPYPYKSHSHKNPYSSLLGGPVSSKLAAAAAASSGSGAGLYSDESRLHGLASLADPLANMGSSLRPSAAMRLRNKPFIFQPQVLPIYTRHSILTSPLDVAAAAAGAKAAAA